MLQKNKFSYFNFKTFFTPLFFSFLFIGAVWIVCIGLQTVGCSFPKIEIAKFSELGFFALTNFSFITFLSMIPFQMAEGKLSPGFYARFVKRPWSHFGLYILVSCWIICYLISSNHEKINSEETLSHLFFSLIASVGFAVIFHRNQTLRYLHHPMIVYENLVQLAKAEGLGTLWLDLYECTLKAIKESRINDARSFANLMAGTYAKISDKEEITHLQKDLHSLYQAAKDQHPIASQIKKNWPFLHL